MRIYDKLTLFISLLSLLVSIFVAYKQFQPVKDALIIEGILGFSLTTPLDEDHMPSRLLRLYGKDKVLGGPFLLQLTLSNNLSRTVSVKTVFVNYIHKEKKHFFHSLVRAEDYDENFKIIKIDGNSVERRNYRINLPIYMTKQTRKCLEDFNNTKKSNTSIYSCYYKKGIDIFGEKSNTYLYEGEYMPFVANKENMPAVKVQITTGDNTVIEKIIYFDDILPPYIDKENQHG